MGTEPVLPAYDRPVGREVEVQQIVDVVQRQGASYIRGAVGIGKSLVLAEVARRLTTAGADVIVFSGTEATAVIPLAPLLKLCPPGADDAGSAIMAELYRRSRQHRAVVLVDDAHLLDTATAAIVRQMATAPAVGVAVAVRSGEEVPAAVDSICRDGHATVLELTELDRSSSFRLVERLLGPTEDETLEWIHRRTRGHPLYLRELLVAGRQTGALQQRDGRWRHDPGAPVWTARLHALVATRLQDLSAEEREAMELVAVGGTVPFRVLCTIVDLDVLVELASRRLLAVDAVEVEMDHPIIAETLLATIGPERASSARLRLAAALERHPDDHDPITVVQLRLDAGDSVGSELLLEALDAALVSRLPQVAERFARVANQVVGPSTRMRLVESLAMQRRWREAEQEFARLAEDSDQEVMVAHLERWVEINFWYRDELSTTRQIAVEAQDRLGHRGTDRWRAVLMRIGIFSGNLDAAIADHDRWLKDRRVSAPSRDIALVDVAVCASHSGAFHRVREIAAEFDDHAEGADPVNLPWLRGVGLVAGGWTDGQSALAGELEAFVDEMVATADPDMGVLGHIHAGMALNDLTCHAQATPHLEKVVELGRYARYRRPIPLTLAELARALVFTRADLREARGWLDRAAAFSSDARWVSEPVVRLVEGILEHAAGRDPWAAFESGLDHARRRSARIHEVMILRQMAQYGRAERVAGPLEELAGVMVGGLVDLVARETGALAAGDAHALDGLVADAEAFGAIGIAADAAAQAARLHSMAGRVGRAFASLYRSDVVLQRTPGQRSLVRDGADPILSSRERQVVDAVIGGASNREVAEQLYISHRTVESHLRRIYKRLGLAGREDLAELLRPAAPDAAATA